MRNILGWWAAVVLGLATLGGFAAAWDDPSSPDKEQTKRRSKQLEESLTWYQMLPTRNATKSMKPEIVQRWSNPIRAQLGETALVVWTEAGRPEALASVYPWSGSLIYELVSLSRGQGLHALEGSRTVWAPDAPGVTFQTLPNAPVPAKTAVTRLAQMRTLAETFKVAISSTPDGTRDREEMRLLPKPVHRLDLAATKAAYPDLLDGATFAFVQGTDPEAVLMIEVVRQQATTTWRFAFARATTMIVTAKLGDQVVWTANPLPSWNDPKLSGIALGRRLVD